MSEAYHVGSTSTNMSYKERKKMMRQVKKSLSKLPEIEEKSEKFHAVEKKEAEDNLLKDLEEISLPI